MGDIMAIDGWKYYNYAMIPATPPHETPNMHLVENGDIWKIDGCAPLLARWTTDFDCGYETEWWYCIKDTPLDIDALSSKRRYEINKGKRNFEVKRINPAEFWEEMYEATLQAYSERPSSGNINTNKEIFKERVEKWQEPIIVIAAFSRESGVLSGFAFLIEYDRFVDFNMLRTVPSSEKFAVNAAIVTGICDYYKERLSKGDGFYISDGARNILHQTAFQSYLEKYFGFRKAYCKLHIKYRKGIGIIVNMLMPFRKVLYKLQKIDLIRKITGILSMDEISRTFK